MPQLLTDDVVGKYEKILLYGAPKTGKTFAAGTMPGTVYILCLGGENELKTLRSPDFLRKHPEKNGKFYYDFVREKLGKRGQFLKAEAFDWAGDRFDEMLEAERKGDIPPIDSVVLDNATTLRSFAMAKSISVSWGADAKTGTSMKRYRDEGMLIPGDNDYFGEQSLISQLINWLFNLEKHVLVITHEWKEVKTDRKTRTRTISEIKPLFTGKQRDDIPTMFDNVWRNESVPLKKKGIISETRTVGDDIIWAGTRFGGVLPNEIRDINIEECINKMIAHRGKEATHEEVVEDEVETEETVETTP